MDHAVNYSDPVACGLTMRQIGQLAQNFSSIVGFNPGESLEDVVAALGGNIVLQNVWELDDSDSGSIRIREKNDFDIYLATHTSRERDRFTVAHELGHYVLHYLLLDDRKPMKASRYGNTITEREANWFAACLLMPEADFLRVFGETGGSLEAIADRYDVSLAAARARASALRLI